jgi:hypothetical protein
MEENGPDRDERRRQEKSQGTWNEEEWGNREYREFPACPVCGCPNRYSLEALRGEVPEDKLLNKPPAIGSFQLSYLTPLHRITLNVVVDSCCKCGALITVARGRKKLPRVMIPRGGDSPQILRRRQT